MKLILIGKWLPVILLLRASLAIQADAGIDPQQPITLGVFRIAGPHRVLASDIADLLTANLSTNENFSLVDRTQLDKVLEELKLGLSGSVDADTAARVGHLTGAKVLVTGRELLPNGVANVVIVANVIGTENGRVFSVTSEGPRSNLVALVATLSQKLADTINRQSSNLVASSTNRQAGALDEIIRLTKGRKLATISINIHEDGFAGASTTAGADLKTILQKAGFTILDEKSSRSPDVLITGDAVAGKPEKRGDVFSCSATISIKAQERASGKIISLDLERSSTAGLGDQTTRQQAIQQAADQLSLRLAPRLVH
jgi:hypothetical protein